VALRLLAALLLPAALVAVAATAVPAAPQAGRGALRGLWVVRTSLTSPQAVTRVVEQARAAGVTALFVQVRGRGDAFYNSRLEPRAAALGPAPAGFDPLAATIAAAGAAGLDVHAWINVNLAASASGSLPTQHVLARHPDWAMLPRALAGERPRKATPTASGRYATLAAWTRRESATVEGVFTSVIDPGAADHTVGVVADIARRYDLDGIHLDYLRYPRDDFDYAPRALAQFRDSVLPDLEPAQRTRLDARRPTEPLVFADTFPERWSAFRRDRLTSLVSRLRAAVRRERPGALVSAAVYPDSREAAARKLQDWPHWARQGLLDAVCPMAYTPDDAVFARQIGEAVRLAAPARVWAGIGAYKIPPRQAGGQARVALEAGSDGIVLFSFDSMSKDSGGVAGYLAEVGGAAPRGRR
jgi:uncharacterized lipoprotein YddW (UPF0748 family)